MSQADSTGLIFESIHVRKDGSSFPVEVSARSILIGNEKIWIHIVRDISERKKSEEKIKYLASHDALTGIPNRSHLMSQLDAAVEHAKRGKHKFALMLFDIDKFKLINDIHGHLAGDLVLKTTANRILNIIRKTDTIGRLGGDEFVVIQSYIKNPKDAECLALKILKEAGKPINHNGEELRIVISIGISIYPDDANNVKKLLNYADSAMYASKQKGGNKFEFFRKVSNKEASLFDIINSSG